MSWLTDLYETKIVNEELIPPAHSTANAQITITVLPNGDFSNATIIPKEKNSSDYITVIPVTKNSGGRSSGVAAHPLHDKLEYIAGDYLEFYKPLEKEKSKKKLDEKFPDYIKEISSWADSNYSSPEIIAIKNYVEKGTIISDLISADILKVEDNILTADKISSVDQRDCFVRFNVSSCDEPLYKDAKFCDLYSKYANEKDSVGEKSLCYVTGEQKVCADKHPAKICHAGDKSKLISSNGTNFEYKGRFTDSKQAAEISTEVSEKAHNNLKFLIQTQGFRIGTLTIVAWEKKGAKIIPPMKSTHDIFEEYEDYDDDDDDDEFISLGETYARRLKNAMNGFNADLETKSEIVVLALEAATTGRLSVAFYEKFDGSTFMKNIEYWHENTAWKHSSYSKKKDKSIWVYGAPSPKKIAEACFGKNSEKAAQSTVKRILPCIILGKKFPKDLMYSAVKRCINPLSYEFKTEFSNQVAITCTIIKKVKKDYFKEEISMALDENLRNRSYLFGRLLAAAQKLEEDALRLDNISRETAAERYMSQFVKVPAKTFAVIEDRLSTYKGKLKSKGKTYMVGYLQKIYDLIETEDFNNTSLDEMYLLGYNQQMNYFYTSKKDDNKNTEEE